MTITIETGSFEDLKRQLKAIGFVPANEVVHSVKGSDLVVAFERAKESLEQIPDAPEALTKETYSDPATDTSASDQADTAKAEEAPKRKRRSKAEIEAEKNAAATKEEVDETVDDTGMADTLEQDNAEANADDDDDDLTGDDTEEEEINIDVLRAMIKERVSDGKKPQVIALFTKFSTDKLPNLAEEKYPAFYAELSKI